MASGSRTARRPQPGAGTVRLPINAHTGSTVTLPAQMSAAEWEQMLAALHAVKPGIVANGHFDAASVPAEGSYGG